MLFNWEEGNNEVIYWIGNINIYFQIYYILRLFSRDMYVLIVENKKLGGYILLLF